MGVGSTWHGETEQFEDPISGRNVTRLTNYLGHSYHLYFTDPCFFNNDRSFVFMSERENALNVYRKDLDTGMITQLTDLKDVSRGFFCKKNNSYYFWQNQKLIELHIETCHLRVIYEVPEAYIPRKLSVTADGTYVCSLLQLRKDVMPATSSKKLDYAYSDFHRLFEANPLSQVVKIHIQSGQMEVMHEGKHHMGHVNTSPTRPELLTFCHEGPWYRVQQRMWGLNIQTGDVWKIRPQNGEVALGHEYWFSDGETIGYHGKTLGEKPSHFFGTINWDGSEGKEHTFPYKSMHFASNDKELMAGDGTPPIVPNALPYIMLFKRDGDSYQSPRILCQHRSTFNNQYAHPHPRFTPDGKYIMYSSDLTNYSNIYLVEVGDIEDLPKVDV